MSNYPPAFIDDGYTRTVTINGEEMLHPPVTFAYRPFTGSKGATLFQSAFSGASTEKELCELLSSRILSWDLGPEPNAENLPRLNGRMFDKILKVVLGMAPPDGEKSDVESEDEDVKN